jgi:hypothetical protein
MYYHNGREILVHLRHRLLLKYHFGWQLLSRREESAPLSLPNGCLLVSLLGRDPLMFVWIYVLICGVEFKTLPNLTIAMAIRMVQLRYMRIKGRERDR